MLGDFPDSAFTAGIIGELLWPLSVYMGFCESKLRIYIYITTILTIDPLPRPIIQESLNIVKKQSAFGSGRISIHSAFFIHFLFEYSDILEYNAINISTKCIYTPMYIYCSCPNMAW